MTWSLLAQTERIFKRFCLSRTYLIEHGENPVTDENLSSDAHVCACAPVEHHYNGTTRVDDHAMIWILRRTRGQRDGKLFEGNVLIFSIPWLSICSV